jgi:hypothetical protein
MELIGQEKTVLIALMESLREILFEPQSYLP